MYLVFDIGGTNMRIATSSDGKSLSSIETTPTPDEFEDGVAAFKVLANKLINGQKIEAAAGGITGPLDKLKTTTLNPPHQPKWKGKPLKDELEKIFNTAVYLENDTALAALGEAVKGAGQNKNIVVYMTISTGVGGARVVGGKIDTNSLGFEVGHQIIVIDGEVCNCGGKGHLESYVSGSAIERIYGKKAEEITDPKIWDQVAKYLAIGLNNTIVHFSPDIVILGGSVMKSLPLDKISAHLQDVLTIFPTCPQLTKASLGDSAGLYGALLLLHPFLQIS